MLAGVHAETISKVMRMELQKLLDSLKKKMNFKSGTAPGDIILVGMQSGLFYGLVQSIDRNIKKNWYDFSFTLLGIPPVDLTWILRIPQFNGEVFTINDEEHFIIAVDTGSGKSKSSKKKTHAPRLVLVKNPPEDTGP